MYPLILLALTLTGVYTVVNPYLSGSGTPSRRPLRFADLNVLHTTDTHGWLSGHLNQPTYNADWGDFVSFVHHVKKQARDRRQDLLLVDSGDRHDGNGLSDITSPNGARSLPIFTYADYDIITLGNHELYLWENSQQEVNLLIPHYREKYICSNVEYEDPQNGTFVPFSRRYRYFSTPEQNTRILAFAFLFDFNRANDKTRVTPIERAVSQQWFKDVLQKYPPSEVDVVLVVGHIPVSRKWTELQVLHSALRAAYPHTVIQYFGGHSHIRDFSVLDDKSSGLQSGRFCETVGFLSIDLAENVKDVKRRFFRSYIDFNIGSFMFHSGIESADRFVTEVGRKVKKLLAEAREDLKLDAVLGYVQNSNYYMDYVPLTHPKNIFRLLTDRILPTLPNNSASEKAENERIIIINTGSVRYDLYKGPYTIDSHFIVSPFQNDWVKIRVSKEIAIKIAPKLNEREYILASDTQTSTVCKACLKPPHQRYNPPKSYQWSFMSSQNPLKYPDLDGDADATGQLSKGYVTFDDFGHSGDDTPHRALKNYPIPNVVQSLEVKPGLEGLVDVVFYSFLIPNVRWAVESLGGKYSGHEIYSDKYLGLLLDEYVADNSV